MRVHSDDTGWKSAHDFGDLYYPECSEEAARNAVLMPDAGESFVFACDQDYLAGNRIELARAIAARAADTLKETRRRFEIVETKLEWTPEEVSLRARNVRRDPLRLLAAGSLGLIGAAGLVVSNFVLSGYIASSASDLFANDPIAATLFSTLPALCAVGLGCYERELSPAARWRFRTVLFFGAMASFCGWLFAAAVSFAPQAIASLGVTAAPPGEGIARVAVVLTTVLTEFTICGLIMIRAQYVLASDGDTEREPNPQCAVLQAEKERLQAAIAEIASLQDRAHDFLSRAAHGRELTRCRAEAELARARELFNTLDPVARALAMSIFLQRR